MTDFVASSLDRLVSAWDTTPVAALVRDPSKLDTRGPLPRELPSPDVFDERLPAGVALPGDGPWQPIVSVIGPYGPSLGSYNDVIAAADFVVDGQDVRFRLGKADRGIGSARVAPAVLV